MTAALAVYFVVILSVVYASQYNNANAGASMLENTQEYFSIDDSLIVETTHGKVAGHKLTIDYNSESNSPITTIQAWQGIPFAEAPLGNLRWQSPVAADPWSGILTCDKIRQPCVQSNGQGSEDCLYLNVYRPENATNKGLYPVLYYIYGGALMFGGATDDFNKFIAHAGNGEGVIVVTVSYRLNIFGFLASKELSEEQGGFSGNYGIMDQIKGLEWVRDNIERFGGDKNRVTIAGQSSGGTSVFGLMSSPLSKGLVHRAISLSGSPNISMPLRTAEKQNEDIIQRSPCVAQKHLNTSAEIMACMRSLSVSKLVSLVPSSWNTPGIWNLPKSPLGQDYAGLLIVDGKVVTDSFVSSLRSGMHDIPLMFGNMQYEPDEYPEKDVSQMTALEWRKLLDSTFSSWPDGASISRRMYELYLNDSTENPQKAYDAIVSDYGVICPSVILTRNAFAPLGKYQSKIYLYVNTWGLSSWIKMSDTHTVRYAFHYLDFIYLLENWKAIGDGTFVPQDSDKEISRMLQESWFDFISNGNVIRSSRGTWRPVNDGLLWPAEYLVYKFDKSGSGMVPNYRVEVCNYYESIGLTQPSFWWVN